MTVNSIELDYAPKPSLRKRRWFRRLAWGLVVVMVVAATLQFGGGVRNPMRAAYWERRCLGFSISPDTVAYEEDPARAAALWKAMGTTGDFTTLTDGQTKQLLSVSLRPRAQWEASLNPSSALYQHGSLFLGARRARGGAERLICVHADAFMSYRRGQPRLYGADAPDLTAQVIRPATPWRDGQALADLRLNVGGFLAHPFGTLRFYAGQPDPNDDSHFTIDYQSPAGRGTIDGWLQRDDTIKMQMRGNPTTAPATGPT